MQTLVGISLVGAISVIFLNAVTEQLKERRKEHVWLTVQEGIVVLTQDADIISATGRNGCWSFVSLLFLLFIQSLTLAYKIIQFTCKISLLLSDTSLGTSSKMYTEMCLLVDSKSSQLDSKAWLSQRPSKNCVV